MSLKAKIEAVLFVTGKAMDIEEISGILKASTESVEEAMLELIMEYSSRDGALEIDDEDGYIIQVKEDYSNIVEQLIPIEMSQAVLKTLSMIAIKQPVLQSDLVTLRGVTVYDHINSLLEMGLITKKAKAKSYMIKTTPKFQEYFKLKGDVDNLSELLKVKPRK